MLLEEGRDSDKFSHLATEILTAEKQNNLDVSQFTDNEAAQLIELIEARVMNP